MLIIAINKYTKERNLFLFSATRIFEKTVWIRGIILGIIITIAYIYADYIPHAKFYAEKYDRIFCKEKPRAKRGLARIYYNEYKNTKFDDRSSLYKNRSKSWF